MDVWTCGARDCGAWSMELAHRRIMTARQICDRVTDCMDRILSDDYALRIAVCCALRNPSASLDFATNRDVRMRAMPHIEKIRVSLAEFNALFGYGGKVRDTEEAQQLVRGDQNVRDLLQVIEKALTYALSDEDVAANNWKRSSCRLAAIVAMEMEDSSAALRAVLGPVGESDNRRLDDAREQIEQLGTSTNAVSTALEALLRMTVLT